MAARFPEFDETTLDYVAATPIARRKQLGQYFTPRTIRERLLDRVALRDRGPRILDPACGTGEFLRSAVERFPGASLAGFEIDAELAARARRVVPGADVRCVDALRVAARSEYDLVVGNPPYFEFLADMEMRRRFHDAISGRPNSYALFVKLGIDLLRDGGVLAYVVPPSMNNGAFFRALRATIADTCTVESLEVLDTQHLFEGAQQAVMLLVLRKERSPPGAPQRHVFRRGPFVTFCGDAAQLEARFAGRQTLADLGYRVRTGSIVWNQVRADLVADPLAGTRGDACAPDEPLFRGRGEGSGRRRAAFKDAVVRLIWSHDIRPAPAEGGDRFARCGLVFDTRPARPGFVRLRGRRALAGPALVVNRVVGSVGAGRLRAAVVPDGFPFVAENHVNVVLPPAGTNEAALHDVAAALRSAHAIETMRSLTGNTQLSATELMHLLPI